MNQILISGKVKEINYSDESDISELVIETEKGNRTLLCSSDFTNDVEIGNAYVFKGECINSPYRKGAILIHVNKQLYLPKYEPIEHVVIIGLSDEEFKEKNDEIKVHSLDGQYVYVTINDSMQKSLYPYLEEDQIAIGIKGTLKEESGYLKVEAIEATIISETQKQTMEMRI